MGSSADVHLAWGVDFGDPENTTVGFDFSALGLATWEMSDALPALFGFTEEPPVRAADMTQGEWFETARGPYNERRATAVPLDFRSYGYESGGKALILKRSWTSAELGCWEVDPATLAEPTPAELEAFGKVWTHWNINWPQNVRLLLMTSYG